MNDIVVGRKWDSGAIYIGRPSPLGNPFFMRNEDQRDKVVEQYRKWLHKQVALGNTSVIHELERLRDLYVRNGKLTLGCFCAPKKCHGDVIREFLLDKLL